MDTRLVLHPWNTGFTLHEHREDPSVGRALGGLYLIEIDVSDQEKMCEKENCKPRWASADLLCGNFAQTFHAVGLDGGPSAPSGSPGKFGPETAQENGQMLDDYRRLLAEGPGLQCAQLQGYSR